MPRVRYTADGGHYRVGGVGFDPGDEKDVGDDLADYLEDVDAFDVVDGNETAGTCQEEMGDGEVCGRDLPCQYHSDEED